MERELKHGPIRFKFSTFISGNEYNVTWEVIKKNRFDSKNETHK